jgi:hypothetical protein
MAGMSVGPEHGDAALALKELWNDDTVSVGQLFQGCVVYLDQDGTTPERFVSRISSILKSQAGLLLLADIYALEPPDWLNH